MNIRIGDLVVVTECGFSIPGIVVKIDKDFYGARDAFKTNPVPRGHAIRDIRKPDFIAPTRDGIRDRVMVCWPEEGFTYEDSNILMVVNR